MPENDTLITHLQEFTIQGYGDVVYCAEAGKRPPGWRTADIAIVTCIECLTLALDNSNGRTQQLLGRFVIVASGNTIYSTEND